MEDIFFGVFLPLARRIERRTQQGPCAKLGTYFRKISNIVCFLIIITEKLEDI